VSENRDIWILPTNTSQGTATGEVFRATHNVAIDELPSLSADGTLLAFHSTRSGTTDVWMKNLLTNEIKRLTATEKALGPVTASADGDFVAFVTGIRNATGWHFDTFAIGTADDGHLEKLCEDCGIVSDWSSSGNLLVGYYRSATTQAHGLETGVTLTNLTTGQSRILFENQPDWRFSPDEKWLAFHNSSRQGVGIQQVFIAPLPEEGEIQESDLIPVTDGTDNSFRPAWSPNGNLLYYASERDGHTCIYAQPLNPATKQPAGNTCEVFHVHSARLSPAAIRNSGLIGLSVAKDKIAFTMVETTSDIWIMEPRAAH